MTTNPSRFALYFLAANGLFWLGYGAWCLFNPAMLDSFLAIDGSPASHTEFRAMYGGLQLALGLFWLTCALQCNRLECGLLNFVLVMAGLATARGIGLFMHGTDDYNLWALAYETAMLMVGLFALIRSRQNA